VRRLNQLVLTPNFNDLLIGGLASAAILASVLLIPSPEAVKLFGSNLPPSCAFKTITGFGCFGCGLTRSFAYMGELSILSAFKLHPVGPFLYLFVLSQIPYRFYRYTVRMLEARA
jgi:hypothetical protein